MKDEKKNRILIVDDEESICEILQFNLNDEGYDTTLAYSAEDALEIFNSIKIKELPNFDLILLDIMMEGMSGIKLADHLRKSRETAKIPIIFITAKDNENDMLTGFSVGADDYIIKPFSMQIVLARVKSILRRINKPKEENEESIISYKDLQIFTEEKRVLLESNPIVLTKKEYELLSLLLSKINRTFTREEILERIWYDDAIVMDRTIDVNITRLRKKLKHYSKHIVTRVGYGYVFEG